MKFPSLSKSTGLLALLPMTFLVGCFDASAPTDTAPAAIPPSERAQDIRNQPVLGQQENVSRDPATGLLYFRAPTGESYLLNPNWSRLGADSKGLPKSAADVIGTWYDESGKVEVRIYSSFANSAWNGGLQCNIAAVSTQVEPDYILVGGGAWVDYGTNAGAFVTQAYPVDNALTTFAAQSKDHGPYNTHKLYTYAIGLRLKDNNGAYIPRSVLKSYMEYRTYSTVASTNNSASIQNNVSYFTIGGGARIQWSSKGQLLQSSAPNEGQPGWRASSKSHRTIESCPLTVYAVGITKNYIPNFGYVEIRQSSTSPLKQFIVSPGTWAGSGAARDEFYSEPGWATTGFGGLATSSNGRGRLLTGLKLTYGDNAQVKGEVFSKDHFVNESGTTYSYIVEIRKRP